MWGEDMKRFSLKKFTFLLVIINILFFIGLTLYPKSDSISNANAEERETYLNILTTNKLSYSIVKHIVGDKHYVQYMFKDDIEPLGYKYTEDALSNVSNMDLFIYMGAGAEPWIDSFISELKKGKVGIINSSRGIKLVNYSEAKKYNEFEVKINPYYWLNPDDLTVSLYNIKSAIQERDPKNRDFYEQNYNLLLENLTKALKNLNSEEINLKDVEIFSVNDDLDYLMKYLGIECKKVKNEDLDKELEELKSKKEQSVKNKEDANNLIVNKNKEVNENKKQVEQNKNETKKQNKIIIFTDKNALTQYESKLKELEYKSILFIKPNSIDQYTNCIMNFKHNIMNIVNAENNK